MTAVPLAGSPGAVLRPAAAPGQLLSTDTPRVAAGGAMAHAQPIYFGPVGSRLFGWLHSAAAPRASLVADPAPDGRPAAAAPPLGVLFCAPLGHEDLATHRGLRRLAQALAAAGLPVLRFDYPGWGDSADLPPPDSAPGSGGDPFAPAPPAVQPPQRWLQAIGAAADELRLRSGAQRLALVGVRMGALLAATAAADRGDVSALLAILPVASGQAWLRECRLLGADAPADPRRLPGVATETEIGGLVLDAAAAQAVAALRWPSSHGGPPPASSLAHALLIERDDLPPGRLSEGPAAGLRRCGVAVGRERLSGLGRMTVTAHSAHLPQALIERSTAWLVQRAADGALDADAVGDTDGACTTDGPFKAAARNRFNAAAGHRFDAAAAGNPDDAVAGKAVVAGAARSAFAVAGGTRASAAVGSGSGRPLRGRAASPPLAFPQPHVMRLPCLRVVERMVCIGEAPCLVGVLSTPAHATTTTTAVDGRPRRGLLLLASGAERRIGPHGLWTAFARQRAAAGDSVLRLDLAGIGDSDDRPGAKHMDVPSHAVYDPRCVADIAAALAWLRAECGVDRCDVVGLCSGAYHAWRAALAGVELSTVISVNPVVFHWKDGMSLDPVGHAFGRIAIAAEARRSLRDPRRWAKLLRGQVDVPLIAAAFGGRVADLASCWARGAGRLLGVRLADDLAAELRQVTARGVRLCFVFAETDPGRQLLAQGAGRTLRRLVQRRQVSLQTIAAADHTFTRAHARDSLYRSLQPLLDAPAVDPRAPRLPAT